MKNKILISLVVFGLILSGILGAKLIQAQNSSLEAQRGDVVLLNLKEEVKISVAPNREVVVRLTGYDSATNRNEFHYKVVDSSGQIIEERDIAYGPQDIGWEIEVLKASENRSFISLPISSRWVGIGETKTVETKEAERISLAEGNLVKAPDSKVYRVENSKLRHIGSLEVMTQKGYKWSDVKPVSADTINQYEKGEPITITPTTPVTQKPAEEKTETVPVTEPGGATLPTATTAVKLIKLENSAGVYTVDENTGVKKPITDSVIFKSYDYDWKDVKTVEKTEFDSYQTDEAVKIKEGSLVKESDKSTVYVVENEELKPIASPSVMEKYNYQWDKIQEIPKTVINLHQIGEVKK